MDTNVKLIPSRCDNFVEQRTLREESNMKEETQNPARSHHETAVEYSVTHARGETFQNWTKMDEEAVTWMILKAHTELRDV